MCVFCIVGDTQCRGSMSPNHESKTITYNADLNNVKTIIFTKMLENTGHQCVPVVSCSTRPVSDLNVDLLEYFLLIKHSPIKTVRFLLSLKINSDNL